MHKTRNVLNDTGVNTLLAAARDSSPVEGLTHNLYRYPARFSPRFARTAIELFTEQRDLVFDPFMGGGTALVEALALGRSSIGTDISSLAAFVAEVKTTLLSDHEAQKLQNWAKRTTSNIHMHHPPVDRCRWEEQGYKKHLSSKQTWRLRKAIEQAVLQTSRLRPAKLQNFGRCIILRTAQWALDSRKTVPSVQQFRNQMVQYADAMIAGAIELRKSVIYGKDEANLPTVLSLNRSAIGVETDAVIASHRPPKLILTSPPYPGVHVLYHRWQVDGRKETPAPFWIANKLDGAGAKYYTMGDRRETDLRAYYANLSAAFNSIRQICDRSTVVVQIVAFADPDSQLPRYLDIMSVTGFKELHLPKFSSSDDGRLWRKVPNRKWHADQMGETPGSQEVVLIHKTSAHAASPALSDK